MGYQPTLDGLRALAVIAVLIYHADLRWLPGGFIGVDIFFVVSGYLITSLLVEERRGSMSNDLKRFWLRRAKRLLPALITMVVVTCCYAALFVPDALYRLRTDVPAAATYSTNWWLIASKQSYFEALGRPPLLRHLWSLAVEEQWYLIWPLVFITVIGLVRGRAQRLAVPVFLAALASSAWMAVVFNPNGDASRAYFGTDCRASGLLIGAAAAMVWTPWRWPQARRGSLPALDRAGWVALTLLVVLMLTWGDDTTALYRGGFLFVSLLSIVVVGASVHPGATSLRATLSVEPLRWLGTRSYGLYLWHWPVFMVTRHQDYPWMDQRLRVALGFAVTLALTELSFRLVETPVRSGSAMRRIQQWRTDAELRSRAKGWVAVGGAAALVSVVAVGTRVATASQVDVATGGEDVAFEQPSAGLAALAPVAAATAPPVASQPSAVPPTGVSPAAAPTVGTLPVSLPRRVAVVGDSQANALVKNAPSGLETPFALTNGSVEGCGLVDDGRIVTSAHFRRAFGNCQGWSQQWAASAREARAQISLVVLGAWDVFDLDRDEGRLAFGSPQHDAYLTQRLQEGIAALKGAGSQVALLEVPCYEPVDGGGLIALPERGDHRRTEHLNQLLRQAAAADPAHVTFVSGPREWCTDHTIATDLGYRWDGVHYYRPGAKLVFDTIAAQLLAMPVTS
jgi:peptidoglycan/LPS O-acetylase OafA/YrhL